MCAFRLQPALTDRACHSARKLFREWPIGIQNNTIQSIEERSNTCYFRSFTLRNNSSSSGNKTAERKMQKTIFKHTILSNDFVYCHSPIAKWVREAETEGFCRTDLICVLSPFIGMSLGAECRMHTGEFKISCTNICVTVTTDGASALLHVQPAAHAVSSCYTQFMSYANLLIKHY